MGPKQSLFQSIKCDSVDIIIHLLNTHSVLLLCSLDTCPLKCLTSGHWTLSSAVLVL